MPTYDYCCEACEYTFEQFHGIKEEPTKKCPKCGKNRVKRLVSVGLRPIFRGTGFYETDYKNKQ